MGRSLSEFFKSPLLAFCVTADLGVPLIGGRISRRWIRTCRRRGTGQILRLRWRWRRRSVCTPMARLERLAKRAVHGRRRAHSTPDSVRGHKGLRLGRHGSEDAVLVEPHAVLAAAVVGGLEARTADLQSWSVQRSLWCSSNLAFRLRQ
jgi:hypothetical protein